MWPVVIALVWIFSVTLSIFSVVIAFAELLLFNLLMNLSAYDMLIDTVRNIIVFLSLTYLKLSDLFKQIHWNWFVSVSFEFCFDVLELFDLFIIMIKLFEFFRNFINRLLFLFLFSLSWFITRNKWSCILCCTWSEGWSWDIHFRSLLDLTVLYLSVLILFSLDDLLVSLPFIPCIIWLLFLLVLLTNATFVLVEVVILVCVVVQSLLVIVVLIVVIVVVEVLTLIHLLIETIVICWLWLLEVVISTLVVIVVITTLKVWILWCWLIKLLLWLIPSILITKVVLLPTIEIGLIWNKPLRRVIRGICLRSNSSRLLGILSLILLRNPGRCICCRLWNKRSSRNAHSTRWLRWCSWLLSWCSTRLWSKIFCSVFKLWWWSKWSCILIERFVWNKWSNISVHFEFCCVGI